MRQTVFVLGLLVLLALVGGGTWLFTAVTAPGPLTTTTLVTVQPGETPRTIATHLQQAGVVRNATLLVWYIRLKGWAPRLQAGDYTFETGTSLHNAALKLAAGDAQHRTVTIPEGFTARQIVERLNATEGLTGTFANPPEGAIFPDTYAFRRGTERTAILTQMTKRMDEALAKAWAQRIPNLPLKSPQEALILASIVQKEAASETEMPTVAGVFINRLVKGMKLQSDPTVMYGAELNGRLRKKDLTEPHPFNTYVFAGLPPTPISSPGQAALMAVTHPNTAPGYLYFVATPSQTMHVFSTTYEEHQKNVATYWKTLETTKKEAPHVP